MLPVHRRSMYLTPYGNPVACQRGPRLQAVQPDRVGYSTTLFHIASISLRSNTSWSCAVGGGFVRKQPDPLLGCLEDRTVQLKRSNSALVPTWHSRVGTQAALPPSAYPLFTRANCHPGRPRSLETCGVPPASNVRDGGVGRIINPAARLSVGSISRVRRFSHH